MKPFRTHIRAYQTVSEKQTGSQAGLLPARAIYAWNEGFSRPIVYRKPVPDILHGSYLAVRAISRFNAYACDSHAPN